MAPSWFPDGLLRTILEHISVDVWKTDTMDHLAALTAADSICHIVSTVWAIIFASVIRGSK